MNERASQDTFFSVRGAERVVDERLREEEMSNERASRDTFFSVRGAERVADERLREKSTS